jgi:hypothetical protein
LQQCHFFVGPVEGNEALLRVVGFCSKKSAQRHSVSIKLHHATWQSGAALGSKGDPEAGAEAFGMTNQKAQQEIC